MKLVEYCGNVCIEKPYAYFETKNLSVDKQVEMKSMLDLTK
jgi:hypothetical protein